MKVAAVRKPVLSCAMCPLTAPCVRLKPVQQVLRRATQRRQLSVSLGREAWGEGRTHFFTRHALPTEHLPALTLAFSSGLNGVCFDAECAAAVDRVFLAVIAVPLAGLLASILYALQPTDKNQDSIFEDPSTGTVFQSTDGAEPERDRKGDLAFRAVSYTPWPVEVGFEGERVRMRVGPVRCPQLRTFVFPRKLRNPSKIIEVVLPRPLGIIFEEDAARQRVVVSAFVPGSHAEKLTKVAKMTQREAVQPGDVLRACTCTNFVFEGSALFGAKPPVRTLVVYGADDQRWPKVIAALKKAGLGAEVVYCCRTGGRQWILEGEDDSVESYFAKLNRELTDSA